MSFHFAVNSDIHFGKDQSQPLKMVYYKEEAQQRFDQYYESNPTKIEFLLMPGDLTENGFSGRKTCYANEPIDEVEGLRQFLRKWDAKMPIYISAGNHDEYNAYPHAVHSLVTKRHGCLEYSFKHKGVVFIGCHLYPSSITLLKMRLFYYRKYPIVIFFHYALEGEFGGNEWFPDKQKAAFVEAIKGYNIKAIIVGHRHETTQLVWRGYKVIMGAGTTIPVCKWDNETQSVDIVEQI